MSTPRLVVEMFGPGSRSPGRAVDADFAIGMSVDPHPLPSWEMARMADEYNQGLSR
jgi:hypothetical protein